LQPRQIAGSPIRSSSFFMAAACAWTQSTSAVCGKRQSRHRSAGIGRLLSFGRGGGLDLRLQALARGGALGDLARLRLEHAAAAMRRRAPVFAWRARLVAALKLEILPARRFGIRPAALDAAIEVYRTLDAVSHRFPSSAGRNCSSSRLIISKSSRRTMTYFRRASRKPS